MHFPFHVLQLDMDTDECKQVRLCRDISEALTAAKTFQRRHHSYALIVDHNDQEVPRTGLRFNAQPRQQ